MYVTMRSINLDFANQQLPEHISVMQGDSARKILVELYRNNVEWKVPSDVSAYIAFRRPDGKNLKITSLSDGSPVVSFSDNVATISVPVEVTTMHGAVPLVVVFVDSNGSQIATFPIAISVVENPAVESDLASQLTPKEFDQLLVEITRTNARINELVSSHDSDGAEEYSIDIYGDGNAYITIRSNGTTAVCTVSDNAIFGMGVVRKYQIPERFAPPIAYYEYDGDVELCISDSYGGYTEVVLKNKNQTEAKADGIWFQFVYALAAVYTPKELLDVRVGADGTTYETAGEAVREQMKAASTGSGGGSTNAGAVLYTKQSLTPEQQAQARANIGAAALGEGGGGSGEPGADGFSPVANVTQTASGAVISITDKSGTTTATITNGKDGVDGQPGKDGYTPVKGKDYFDGEDGQDGSPGKDGVSATHSWNGTTLTITSASGTSSADLKGAPGKDGNPGKDGSAGADGVSPTVAVSKSGKVTTVSITDKNGTKTATINDGADGVSVSSVKQTTTSSADGGSNVVTVTLSNGTTSTFTVKNGSKGSSGTNGTNGKDGKTPVKGTDYWTPADQEAIVQQVIAALGTPVFGRVDVDNNIILTGELVDGTYTVKYEDAEGNETIIGEYIKTSAPTYTNVLPLATTNDGKTVYNGTGYKVGARIGSSGSEGTVSNTSATNPIFLTGYIKVPAGATIRMKNCFIDTDGVNGTINNTADKAYYGHDLAGLYGLMVFYNLYAPKWEDGMTNYQWSSFANCNYLASEPTVDSNGYVTEFTLNTTETKYIRMILGGDPTTAIITVNEPITD